jgi:hypothetical protein
MGIALAAVAVQTGPLHRTTGWIFAVVHHDMVEDGMALGDDF